MDGLLWISTPTCYEKILEVTNKENEANPNSQEGRDLSVDKPLHNRAIRCFPPPQPAVMAD